MGFKGNLESINLADIFQNLATNHQTGTLRVLNRDAVKCIFFEHGEIRYLSHGRRKNILLGEMLVGRGIATQEQIDTALQAQQSSGKLLGEVFVEMDIVTQEQIDSLVRFQIEEEIYDLFLWDRADFEFTDGPAPPELFDPEQQTTEVSINTAGLIMEAARRLDEWELIRRKVPTTKEVYISANEARAMAAQGEMETLQVRVIALCDGSRDVDDIVAESFFSRFEVAKRLCDMLEQNLVRPANPSEIQQAVTRCKHRGDMQQVVKLYEKVLAISSGDDTDVRAELAEACAAVGNVDKAAIHFGILADAEIAAEAHDRATELFERILTLAPHNIPARDKLAVLCLERGQKKEALTHYIKLIGLHSERDHNKAAQDACRKALEVEPTHADVRRQLVQLHLESGDRQGAIAELEALAERHLAARNARAAADTYRQILQVDKNNAGAKEALSNVLKGREKKKRGKFRKMVVTLFGLLLLAGAVYEGHREWKWNVKFKRADDEARDLESQNRFTEAADLYKPLEDVFTVYGNVAQRASTRRTDLERRALRWESKKNERRQEANNKAQQDLEEARRLWNRGESLDVIRLCKRIEASECEEQLKKQAETLRQLVEKKETTLAEFDAWHGTIDRKDLKQDLEAVAKRVWDFKRDYRKVHTRKALELPLKVTSDPSASEAIVRRGKTKERKLTPALFWYPVSESVVVTVQRRGYTSRKQQIRPRLNLEDPPSPYVSAELRRTHIWRTNLRSHVKAGPTSVLGGRFLVVGTVRGRLVSIERATGREVGSFSLGSLRAVSSKIHVEGNTLLFGASEGSIFAVRILPTGKFEQIWRANARGEVRATPSVARVSFLSNRTFAFVGSTDGYMYCLDYAKGSPPQWVSRKRVSPILTRAVVTTQYVYAGTRDGNMYAFDVTKAETVPDRSMKAGGAIYSDPVRVADRLYFGSDDGKLHCFDYKNGREKFAEPLNGSIRAQPALRGGRLYIGTLEGYAYCLNALTGKPVVGWTRPFRTNGARQGAILAQAIPTDRGVYFGSADGRLYCLDMATGELKWDFNAEGKITTAPLVTDGRIYFAAQADTGVLYALEEID